MFSNNNSYCRLCAELRPKSDLVEIQDSVATNLNIEYKIFHCLQLQIENDDKLPKCVCSECCEQVITIYEFNEKVQRAQQTLFSIISELEDKLDVQLETLNNDIDEKELLTNLDIKPSILDPADLAQCVFENDTPDNRSGSDEESDDDVPLYKRKLRHRKTKTSLQFDQDNDYEKTISDDSSDVDETKSYNPDKSARLRKILEEWKNYKWSCIKCDDVQLTNIKELREHWTIDHNAPPQYKCMECGKVYEKYDLFKKHVRAHRDKHKFRCDICGKYSYKRAHHDRHIEIHLKVRKYMCSTCGKSFKTHGSLYSHSRMHLPTELKNKYECDICHKCFSSAPNLSSHKKIHSGIKEYTCEQCGKNFTQKVNLDQHIKSKHSDETPFRCSLCPRAFKTVYRLKSHQTLHTNVRPFKCETCGKAFREKGMMKAHSKIHSTEYPFECEYCKKCFKLKAFLKIHLRQHTGERPYSCQDCNHHFTNWSNYSKHMKGRHGINVKSATTQFLQEQRLQLMKQEEEIVQETSDNNVLNIDHSNTLPIPQQIFQSDV